MSYRIVEKVKTFLVAEDGPTIVEYAVLLALIVGMMMAAVAYVGTQGNLVANDIVTEMDDALNM